MKRAGLCPNRRGLSPALQRTHDRQGCASSNGERKRQKASERHHETHLLDYLNFEYNFYVLADYARMVELLIEYGPDLGLPHSRALGQGLFELRPRGRSGIGRALYCFLVGQRVLVIHAFIKKTQQTPDREFKLARKRIKEILNG
jgi:phage-related protein